jgi:hypothetical protein
MFLPSGESDQQGNRTQLKPTTRAATTASWPPLATSTLTLYHCTLPSLLCASSSMHEASTATKNSN